MDVDEEEGKKRSADAGDALTALEMLMKKAEMNLALLVAEHEIDLSSIKSYKGESTPIYLYILELDTDANAAGGRVGGFGSRRFKRIHIFRIEDGRCVMEKSIELDEEAIDLDLGYVVRLPIRLSDGREVMASCSIDNYTVRLLNARFGLM